jgi:immunity protein, SdpI family
MKFSWRTELPQLIIIAAMFAAAVWSWSRVPDRMPTHWNIRGEVDGFGGKFTGLLLMPLVTLGIYGLMLALPRFDPGKANYANFATTYNVMRCVFTLFMAVIYCVTLLAAFGHQTNMTIVIQLAMSALFLVLGNFMSKIRPNWFVGVRTPWTLSSKLSWDKTHRLAGWVFIFSGVLFAIAAVINAVWMSVTSFVVLMAGTLWTIIYSYLVYRSDPNRTPPAGTLPSSD